MTETEQSNCLQISEKMRSGPIKTIMEFLENNSYSSIQSISADKTVKKTKKKVREIINFLRKIGFVSVEQKNGNHLFFPLCVFNAGELPRDINEFMETAMIILPIIEAYGPNEIKILAEDFKKEVEAKTGKHIPREAFDEYIKLLPKTQKRITVYNCPASNNLTINFAAAIKK